MPPEAYATSYSANGIGSIASGVGSARTNAQEDLTASRAETERIRKAPGVRLRGRTLFLALD